MPDTTAPGGRRGPVAARRHQEHFFAETDETGLGAVDAVDDSGAPSSMWSEAWRKLRRRPIFWVSAVIIVVVCAVAAFPQLFTSIGAHGGCDLANSHGAPRAGHPFGFDRQGCDIYTRTIYGARASVTVGVLATAAVVLVGSFVGAIAGYFGGWFDTILSRVTDIFFAVPLVLAAIVIMQVFTDRNALMVAVVLASFGWPNIARITRGAVLSVKNNDFITAARALGSGRLAILARHVMPNAAAPIIVYATVALGVFIVAEATLSFLGIGLPTSVVSWGGDISKAQDSIRSNAEILFYPAGGLAVTVLGFMMMGDAVRDALDPKLRER
ncbi:ABC transporter permease [Georgenia alba]|uniref:ABC transporter permease n=1 Tax=Georgenia alba TaxID=2233858 RepID=A0ABW2Q6Z8_9MICO